MLSLKIALRYLFAPKSHRAINAITLVAACGVAIVTAALVCILSVYNGFESLVEQLTSQLDPQLRIEATRGKSFADNDTLRQILAGCSEVEAVSATLDETVLIISGGRQLPARMKGVDRHYRKVCGIDSIIVRGEYRLSDPASDYAMLGAGLSVQAACRPGFIRPMTFFCPKRAGKIDLLHPEDSFVEKNLYCSATFAVQQAEYDDQLCITSIETARFLLQDSTLCTAYEVRLRDGADTFEVERQLQEAIDRQSLPFNILNRHEQQADNYRIVQVEKWITFMLILFILLITSFNIAGAISMLFIDKQAEIATLRHLGASHRLIRWIFTCEGLLISCTGAAAGILLGVVLCLLQQEYGIIGLGDGTSMFVVDSYPVELHWSDVWLSAAMTLLTSSSVMVWLHGRLNS